jgi:hypothetical protein
MPARITRRTLLRGWGVTLGLPPLEAMFNSSGTAYAATAKPVEPRFVFWFNGNGIPEKYWIPQGEGADFEFTPCLSPLAPFRKDIHVVSGLDSPAARLPGPGNSHYPSMSALLSGKPYTGRGAGGMSFDQYVARKAGESYRFRSLQIGVSQESFGEAIQRNMSWADRDRPLPPEMLPHKLFDRLFGQREIGWVNRKRSVLDAIRADANALQGNLGSEDQKRLTEHLDSIRDIERSIASMPPQYYKVDEPEYDGDMKDWPRIAKLQSDLLAHAFATRQTRVASYMLTKCQGLTRFPWLGHTAARHHDYTHRDGKAPGMDTLDGQRIMRDICRWHVEEFAYLLGKLRSIPEGDGTLLDRTALLFVHEHAEANDHKNNGLSVILAGFHGNLATGTHTRTTGTVADLYLTVADDVMGAGIGKFPTAERKLSDLVRRQAEPERA